LQNEESAYTQLEHSLTDVIAQQALKLAKLFDIEAELFIYTEGRDVRLLIYAMDEISNFKKMPFWIIYRQTITSILSL
jgi:hypothetical protein